ncbi:CST complex subunit STN1 isoform 2-T2 [Pholidichthys leucotaenia]
MRFCFHDEMQAVRMDPAEEPPSILWGLDPLFSAFARLYVRDILEMTESIQVDVLGTVVYKREREDFFCYGVDDSTGVINCLCWKSELLKEEQEESRKAVKSIGDGAWGGFDAVAELKKLKEAERQRCHLDIGDLIRVRGTVKTSRQQREIMASTYYKVDDPVMAVQISWMMEVPQLYRQCYDKQPNTASDSGISSLSKATNILKDFLKQKSVSRFRPYDVQDLLQPLIPSVPQTGSTADQAQQDSGGSSALRPVLRQTAPAAARHGEEPVAGPSACQQLRQLLKEALQTLQDDGVIYRKVKSQDEAYLVTERDKDLIMAVKDVIREDCRREKYLEKGCHVLHILSAVRQRYSPNVSRAALELVLRLLECDSNIISTSENHYTVV